MENVSLVTAADVEKISAALGGQAFEEVKLLSAKMDVEETPTVSAEAAGPLAAALGKVAASVKRLTLLEFRFASPAVASEVVGALASFTKLEELDLTNSSLGPEGGGSLGAALLGITSLRTLKLEDCELEDDGCAAVARALSAQSHLEAVSYTISEPTRRN